MWKMIHRADVDLGLKTYHFLFTCPLYAQINAVVMLDSIYNIAPDITGVALTIRHIANGETVSLVAKDIRGHCATVAKRFSERTNRTHPPCSPHIFSFCPLLSSHGERTFSNQALWRECSLNLKKNELLTEVE